MLNELDDMSAEQLRSAMLHLYLRGRFHRAELRTVRKKLQLPELPIEDDFTPRVFIAAEHPPVPSRDYDYSAVDRNTYDGDKSQPVGRGSSPVNAENDLLDQIQDKLEDK